MYKNLKSNNDKFAGENSIASRLFSVTSGNCDRSRGRLFNVCCCTCNPPHSALKRHSLPQGAREYGRSMIEMLGVLAIIAVLTVGGIAGYSKAMEKLQINQTIGEYNSMLVNVIENIDAFTSKNSWSSTIIVEALNIAPAGWKVEKTSHLNLMSDNTGNKVEWFPENNRQLRIMFHLGGGESHQQNLCVTLINDVILPLRSVIGMLYFNRGGIYYYLGDNYCPETRKPWDKCMSYLNLSNINQQCKSCAKSGICTLNLLFYH